MGVDVLPEGSQDRSADARGGTHMEQEVALATRIETQSSDGARIVAVGDQTDVGNSENMDAVIQAKEEAKEVGAAETKEELGKAENAQVSISSGSNVAIIDAAHSDVGAKIPLSDAGRPSLPPFLKSSAAPSVAASTAMPTEKAADEARTSDAVNGAQIDGVGFTGTAAPASTGCKCVIM